MTRFTVILHPDAEAEFRAAFLWYFERSPLAADAIRSEVFQAIDSLADTAACWPADEDQIHRHHLKHFPYTVIYEASSSGVTVLAVAHQRRRPGYWKLR